MDEKSWREKKLAIYEAWSELRANSSMDLKVKERCGQGVET